MISFVLFLSNRNLVNSYFNVLLLQNQISKVSKHWQEKILGSFLTQEQAILDINRKVVIFISKNVPLFT